MLYPKEKMILRFLARGWSYTRICEGLKINLDCLYTHCFNIRKSTGIKDTKNAQECKDYLYGHGDVKISGMILQKKKSIPTQAQLRCMKLHSEGKSYAAIAEELGIAVQTVRNHVSQGCIFARLDAKNGYYSRSEAIRQYISAVIRRDPMDDPMFLNR